MKVRLWDIKKDEKVSDSEVSWNVKTQNFSCGRELFSVDISTGVKDSFGNVLFENDVVKVLADDSEIYGLCGFENGIFGIDESTDSDFGGCFVPFSDIAYDTKFIHRI